MNDIPIINALPEKWRGWALMLFLATPYLTRAFYAISSGGGIVGIFRAVFWGSNTPKASGDNGTSQVATGKGLSVLLAVGLCAALCGGCAHPQLEAGGAYAPTDSNGVATAEADYDLFVVDSAFALAHDAAGAVFRFERDNRAMLWKVSPDIKHGLDQARAAAKTVDLQYATARSAYLANPSPANLTPLQQLLGKAQALTAAAQTLLSTQGSNGPPAGLQLSLAPATNAPAGGK